MDSMTMDMGQGVPGYFEMQKLLWAVVGSAIAFATLINVLDWTLAAHRLRSLSARPKTWPLVCFATATAITREVSQVSFGTIHIGPVFIQTPSLGKAVIGSSWLIVVFVFCFYGYDITYQWDWESIAYRCGCIAQSQLPLIFLMASKQNLVGYLTGFSYERLHWLHRWVGRVLWITVTMHMGFWFRSWARYNYILYKLRHDDMTQTGFASWIILTVIVLSSFRPIRFLSYEVFFVLHIILIAGLLGSTYLHFDYGPGYFWACIGIYFLDRFIRCIAAAFANIPLLRGKRGFWANSATLTPMPGDVTRVTIDNPVARWAPGQHMFVSCHGIAPLQAHPFTISSLPTDNKIEFFIGARKGGTQRLNRWASKYQRLPDTENLTPVQKKPVGLEGPYGRHRPFAQFDSVVFVAGSTGATFTMPLMRDLVRRWKANIHTVTRAIEFVWVIKAKDRLAWFQDQLLQAKQDVQALQNQMKEVQLNITIYVTCDDLLEATPSHGTCGNAQAVAISTSITTDEKKALTPNVEVNSRSSRSTSLSSHSDRGCQCRKIVGYDSAPQTCCCTGKMLDSSSSSSSGDEPKESASARHLHLKTGRPPIRTIIRRVLEQADGESAVVACGPSGLQDDVRRSVVALSDERAVHKGTGAQGIYLHVEGFAIG